MHIITAEQASDYHRNCDAMGEHFMGVLGQFLLVTSVIMTVDDVTFHVVHASSLSEAVHDWNRIKETPVASETYYRCESAAEVRALLMDFCKAHINDEEP